METLLDEMTQQNATLVEQAAASQSMGERAHELSEQVSFFVTGENVVTEQPTERRAADRHWSSDSTTTAEAGQSG